MIPEVGSEVVRKRVLQTCHELFMAHGVRAVTMDDVATQLGMSKKTIYQYFAHKEEILRMVAQTHIEEEKEAYTNIIAQTKDAIDEMVQVTIWDVTRSKDLNPLLPQEVCRFFPDTWQLFVEYSSGFILDLIRANLIRGMNEGLYRADMDAEVVARINVSSWESLINPKFFPATDYPLQRIQYHYMLLYLHGIVSPKGAILLQQYLERTPIPM